MPFDLSILVWLASPSDRGVACTLLQQAGLDFHACPTLDALIAQATQGVGAVLIEEEGLTAGAMEQFNGFLSGQPSWSDPRVILMVKRATSTGSPRPWSWWVRNLIVVDRPVSSAALISVLRTALTARQRQYEIRDLLTNVGDLNRSLEQHVAELTDRAVQLRAMAGELALAEQRERKRLAKVLHDNLQQLLVGAKFHTSLLARSGDPAAKETGREVENLLGQALVASRTLTTELSPPILEEGGLGVALKWLGEWMADRHGLAVEVTTDDDLPQPVEDVKVFLFESVRELLFNAVKHSKVRSATVHAHCLDGRLWIVVADKGVGFDPARIAQARLGTGGFGLLTIRERLTLIGGQMEIDSAPGQGCRFVLSVPLDVVPAALSPAAVSAAIATVGRPVPRPPDESGRIRVLLADDHNVMRQGLTHLLQQEPDMEVVGQAADGRMAGNLARDLRPDVVLMDVTMPEMNGIEATRAIVAELPEMKVIGLSMFQETDKAQAMRAAGASGYFCKSDPPEAVVAAIRACAPRAAGRQAYVPAGTPSPRARHRPKGKLA